jgi:hypothetical protein
MRLVVNLQTGEVSEDHDFVPPPAPPLSLADYEQAIQSHIDFKAASRGYRDGVALAGYVTSTVPMWAAEATAFIGWRDAVWLYSYGELTKVLNGEREQPTVQGLLDELPSMEWPA